ncbi:NAD(P)-binding domain-containing protein [Streptomyces chiangmaiensis]
MGGRATVVVIGGGQSGLSAGYHLKRRGFTNALTGPGGPDGGRTFVVLDAEPAAGGAWRHRWESLRMATVNGIFDLPDFPQPPVDPDEPSRTALPRYFAAFEQATDLPILRPVTVTAVRRADARPDGELVVDSSAGRWTARAVINATGTWTNPVRPHYPGQESFTGIQLHTHDYVSADRLAGLRVAIVGGGVSALQQLAEISRVATTFWYTRREPVFLDVGFDREVVGREIVAKVAADVEAGRPTGSVASYTALAWTPYALAAKERGYLSVVPCSPPSSPTASVRRTVPSLRWTRSCGPRVSRPPWRTWSLWGCATSWVGSRCVAPRWSASHACTWSVSDRLSPQSAPTAPAVRRSTACCGSGTLLRTVR